MLLINPAKVHTSLKLIKSLSSTDFSIPFHSKSHMAHCFIASIVLTLLAQPAASEDDKTTVSHMRAIHKPLQCHTIDSFIIGDGLRSVLECAMKCVGDLYSCVGYVLSSTSNDTIKCEVCWIYDVTDEVILATNDSTVTIYTPTESRQKGGHNNL